MVLTSCLPELLEGPIQNQRETENLRNHIKTHKSNRMNGGSGAPTFRLKRTEWAGTHRELTPENIQMGFLRFPF